MKKKLRCSSLFFLLLLILQFSSCQGNPGTIISLDARSGEEEIILLWRLSSGVPGNVYVDVSPDEENKYPVSMPDYYSSHIVSNLKANIEYTFTVYNLDKDDEIYSRQTVKAIPGGEECGLTYDSEKKYEVVKIDDTQSAITLKNTKDKIITAVSINYSNVEKTDYKRTEFSRCTSRSAAVKENNGTGKNKRPLIKNTPVLNIKSENTYTDISSRSTGANPKDTDEGTFSFENAQVGQSRYLWLDNSIEFFTKSIGHVEKKEVILEAIGKEDDKIRCFVWAEKSILDPKGESKGKMVNRKICEDIAETFTGYYLHERDIFGEESDKMLVFNADENDKNFEVKPMKEVSKTQDVINIVIYDISNDYTPEMNSEDGYYTGYFFSRDYYTYENGADISENLSDSLKTSNAGKYLYIDSVFCNLSKTYENGIEKISYDGNIKDGNSKVSGSILSTMFHEFQHMINFGNNAINKIENTQLSYDEASNLSIAPTWYNEMLSMLAEDLLSEDLIKNNLITVGETAYATRIPTFLIESHVSGVTEWLSDNTLNSYSAAYTFGAWLVRNYGGPALVSKISHNVPKISHDDEAYKESILRAIAEQTGNTVIWKELLKNFYLSFAIRDPDYEFSMNKNPGNEITSYGHTSSFVPLNIFDDCKNPDEDRNLWWICYYTDENKTYKCNGIFSLYDNILSLRGNGVSYLYVNSVKGKDYNEKDLNTCSISFKGTPDPDTDLYLVIQDYYESKFEEYKY